MLTLKAFSFTISFKPPSPLGTPNIDIKYQEFKVFYANIGTIEKRDGFVNIGARSRGLNMEELE